MRLLSIFLLLALHSFGQQPKPTYTEPTKDDKSTKTAQPKAAAPVTVEKQTTGKPNDDSGTKEGTKPDYEQRIAEDTKRLADYTRNLAIFTEVLIGVGALQFFALVIQARVLDHHGKLIHEQTGAIDRQTTVIGEQNVAITRQAAADEASATAATISAEAMINSERAWILVTDIVQVSVLHMPVFGRFAYSLINSGRTVARLVDNRHGFKVLPFGVKPPEFPDYGGPIPLEEFDAPDAAYVLAQDGKDGAFEILMGRSIAGREKEITGNQLKVYAYGRIMYYDAFDRLRELQFGYVYLPEAQGWGLMREANYNRHT